MLNMVLPRQLYWNTAGFLVFFSLFCLNFVDSKCPKSFHCGKLGLLEFPFSNYTQPECGIFGVQCDATPYPRVHIEKEGISTWYEILSKSFPNAVKIHDPISEALIKVKSCDLFGSPPIRDTPSISYKASPNITLIKCPKRSIPYVHGCRQYRACTDFDIYHGFSSKNISLPSNCSLFYLPCKLQSKPDSDNLFSLFAFVYDIQLFLSDACIKCHNKGGRCSTTKRDKFRCEQGAGKNNLVLVVATAILGSIVIILSLIVFFVWWYRKRRINEEYLLSRNISSDPSSKSDIESGCVFSGIPIFSYEELEEATNSFDSSRQLGDGGFGIVYYGKLWDGREVAIKRLYEHNYKRLEQFMNEIKIFTCLRHPNLVSLYGCTSRCSQELLLVYEYIPNGTVADHLHGDRAKEVPLSWPIRMDIAVETASALAYIHKSDIIHRDVKTNNILLDNNFSVKVADFGLSRLFPNDVTHISTAPQGTLGYVDPEYYQCYQLTDRSDVYSFGVVLIELISSMPAVDTSRHRHDINLANLAISRIQRCAFNELIDPSLGFDFDPEVTRMTTSVAELAFQCLQLEKDLRPSMDEVLAFLKEIRGNDRFETEKKMETNDMQSVPRSAEICLSPQTDDVLLLKGKHQSSPNSVTGRWMSGSTTASSSG